MEWKSYDPTWLVDLAKAQMPEDTELSRALSRCTTACQDGRAYLRFVDIAPESPADAQARFHRSIRLYDRREGELVLDILEDGRVAGIEFLKRL